VVTTIEIWVVVIGLVNLLLFVLGLVFFIPREVFKTRFGGFFQVLLRHLPYLLLIFGVVVFHLVEVNFIDPVLTEIIGVDFAPVIQVLEGDAVFWFSQHWSPVLVYFFVIMYIAVYPFTLWFSLFYFLVSDKKESMETLSYGLLLIYIVALPFYLFVPVTNVYRAYGVESALESVIPTVESFFYSTTTQNNCLPSLHVAMSILVAWSVYLTGNKRLTYFVFFCMVSVVLSVIYLAIHWLTDVVFGGLLAVVVILILKRFIRE